MSPFRVALFLCVLPLIHAPAAAASVAYGLRGDAFEFSSIDLSTGAVTDISSTNISFAGLAVDNHGTLYASALGSGGLWTIDPDTGATSNINIFPGTGYGLGSTADDSLFGLELAPGGTGYVFDLYAVDPAGSASRIGSTGISLERFGAFCLSNGSDTLFMSSGHSLYSINTATAAGTLIGSFGNAAMDALVFADNTLYGVDDSSSSTSSSVLDTIDPTTAAIIPGPVTNDFIGLATLPAPEPTSSLLFAAPLLFLQHRRGRRRPNCRPYHAPKNVKILQKS